MLGPDAAIERISADAMKESLSNGLEGGSAAPREGETAQCAAARTEYALKARDSAAGGVTGTTAKPDAEPFADERTITVMAFAPGTDLSGPAAGMQEHCEPGSPDLKAAKEGEAGYTSMPVKVGGVDGALMQHLTLMYEGQAAADSGTPTSQTATRSMSLMGADRALFDEATETTTGAATTMEEYMKAQSPSLEKVMDAARR
ncbi:hypothetical protein NJC10_02530 [Micrococcus sp. M4NT]|uniref:hypothetical protein n=1 Tax=Micrococcus sp. M4NT TaxID=2957501 RepID=UPI0029B5B47D|nr:hypothetical protein [Micrococcus sp. M4NT]MDX2340554.1 hypothetical protein [Micrococcus sp. M4NT]